MDRERGISAIRTGIAWSAMDHVAHLRVNGEDAFALLDRVLPGELFLRDCQLLQSLLLDENGRILADLYVGREDEDFLLVCEGLSAAELAERLRQAAPESRVKFTSLDEECAALSLHGPYAWELLAELFGAELLGLPYGNLFRIDGGLCLRAGKTGEYGYDLVLPRAAMAKLRPRLLDAGRAFELTEVDLEALDQCALENGFFNVRREGRAAVTPLELQLQWRLSRRKEHVGSAALSALRDAGIKQRATYIKSDSAIAIGDRVCYDAAEIGTIINCGHSPLRGDWVGLALLALPYAYSGVDRFVAQTAAGATPISTVSSPLMQNRSLFVSPQRDSFANRGDDHFPALVRR